MGIAGWTGWILFALATVQYFVGLKFNATKNVSSTAYSIMLLLDPAFWTAEREYIIGLIESNSDKSADDVNRGVRAAVERSSDIRGNAELSIRNGVEYSLIKSFILVSQHVRLIKDRDGDIAGGSRG